MRKLFVLLGALLGVAAAGAGTAQALHSGPELRTYGRGTATAIGVEIVFDFSARLGPHEAIDVFGEPHGRMTFEIPEAETGVTAEVTCLTVVGNRAAIGGRIKSAFGVFTFGRSVVFHVVDNTLPNGENPVPDLFAQIVSADPAPQVCPPPIDGFPLTSGDVVVEQN
jgi:hypothetical protein